MFLNKFSSEGLFMEMIRLRIKTLILLFLQSVRESCQSMLNGFGMHFKNNSGNSLWSVSSTFFCMFFFVQKNFAAAFSSYVWVCNFSTKFAHIKRWWNWHLNSPLLLKSSYVYYNVPPFTAKLGLSWTARDRPNFFVITDFDFLY